MSLIFKFPRLVFYFKNCNFENRIKKNIKSGKKLCNFSIASNFEILKIFDFQFNRFNLKIAYILINIWQNLRTL